jgi:hypothetical protein
MELCVCSVTGLGTTEYCLYSGRKITASFSYVTERARGQRVCLGTYNATKKHLFPLNIDTVDGILIHWLLHYTVFCEPEQL